MYGVHGCQEYMYEKYGREHGVVRTKTLAGKTMLHIFDHADLRFIYQNENAETIGSKLRSQDEFWIEKAGDGADNLPYAMTSEGEKWQRTRKMLHPGINSDAVFKYEGVVYTAARDAVDQVEHYEGPDMAKWSTHATFDMFCSLSIGKSRHTTDPNCSDPMTEILSLEKSALDLAMQIEFQPSILLPRDSRQKLRDAYNRIIEVTSPAIQELFSRDDLPNCWFKDLRDEQDFSLTQLEHLMSQLFTAAIGTTKVILQWMLISLARHPEEQAKVYEEIASNLAHDAAYSKSVKMPYLEAFIRETTRVYPTVAGVGMRSLTYDIVLPSSRIHVPAGTTMLMNTLNASRDVTYNADADQFKPDRFLRENIRARKGCPMAAKMDSPMTKDNFGSGGHSCLGRRAAELEIRMVVCELLKRYELVLDPTERSAPVSLDRFSTLRVPATFPNIRLRRRSA
ncbi:Cytochrome P450 CYP12A2 [Hondaea fermentalgiana]|uniref:Cytochrome P450 CYP12A2 n=1 Tax=Hondaea fermentalgiana TaxID=2315210 RepID=A0A2R5G9J2_9STRA|nr:Cytochrome P450 CYP12A2 [Hondaea fermentalgiana]|eukprot:GBG27215.1 Cytochrome P450 CYP12A2 [Hondaea fermentalgiana]